MMLLKYNSIMRSGNIGAEQPIGSACLLLLKNIRNTRGIALKLVTSFNREKDKIQNHYPVISLVNKVLLNSAECEHLRCFPTYGISNLINLV
jgi:hypothetical protein